MKAYLETFNLENKTCVTIQGSSDHIFELYLKQPKKIIGIDTNPLTQYPFYLKQAAFPVLKTNKDFLKFFRWHDYPNTFKNNYKAIYQKEKRDAVFTGPNYHYQYFTSMRDLHNKKISNNHDAVLIYTKK